MRDMVGKTTLSPPFNGLPRTVDPQGASRLALSRHSGPPSSHYLITTQTVSSRRTITAAALQTSALLSLSSACFVLVLFLFWPHAHPSPLCAPPPLFLTLTAPVPSHSPHSWAEWVESSMGIRDPRRAEGALPHTNQGSACVQMRALLSLSGITCRMLNPQRC